MEEKNWLEFMSKQTQVKEVLARNQDTERFGLVLSEREAELLIAERGAVL